MGDLFLHDSVLPVHIVIRDVPIQSPQGSFGLGDLLLSSPVPWAFGKNDHYDHPDANKHPLRVDCSAPLQWVGGLLSAGHPNVTTPYRLYYLEGNGRGKLAEGEC